VIGCWKIIPNTFSLALLAHLHISIPPSLPPSLQINTEPLTKLHVVVSETTREGVPMPQPSIKPASDKLFVYLWIDHLGNRVYRATRNIGASPRAIQLWNPLATDEEQVSKIYLSPSPRGGVPLKILFV